MPDTLYTIEHQFFENDHEMDYGMEIEDIDQNAVIFSNVVASVIVKKIK